jgi:hypothetical protein
MNLTQAISRIRILEDNLEALKKQIQKDASEMMMLIAFAAMQNGGEFRVKQQLLDPRDWQLFKTSDVKTGELVFTLKKKEKNDGSESISSANK